MGIEDIINNIKWLGHDGFLIRGGGKVVVIDPYQIGSCEAADIVLISHQHYDHCSPDDVKKIQKENTVIVTEPDAAKNLGGDVRVVAPGEKINIDGVDIEAVPAYNVNKNFHPKANQWLGFILTLDGVRIYHAGDTDLIPEMDGMDADIALLPVSGTYVMTAEEAVAAAKRIQPKVAIPMHYGAIVGAEKDAERFAEALEDTCRVVILKQ
jgi:L-ascorbate metabolism protein UlaG (beta-lactamase superfamily)